MPKNRDTRSRDYTIAHNTFRGNETALQIRDTAAVTVMSNTFDKVAATVALSGATSDVRIDPPGLESLAGDVALDGVISRLPGGIDPMIPDGERRGRETIIVDEWGPYDWKSPKLWPVLDQPGLGGPNYARDLKLRVLGPQGSWKMSSVHGATVSPRSGTTGDVITVVPDKSRVIDYHVSLAYTGAQVTSPRGVRTPAGDLYRFGYSRFFAPIDWRVKFFDYTDAADPVKQPEAFARRLGGHEGSDNRPPRLHLWPES